MLTHLISAIATFPLMKTNLNIKEILSYKAMTVDKNSFKFDLQKPHFLPVLNKSTPYYKHQDVLYNKGIHDFANNQGYSHLWCKN